jgi:hypothetical protein
VKVDRVSYLIVAGVALVVFVIVGGDRILRWWFA